MLTSKTEYPPSGRFAIVETWLVVYDESEGSYMLWCQRRIVNTIQSAEFKEVRSQLMKIVEDQEETLLRPTRDSSKDDLEVVAFVGWGLYPVVYGGYTSSGQLIKRRKLSGPRARRGKRLRDKRR